jgi:hypothetical protein
VCFADARVTRQCSVASTLFGVASLLAALGAKCRGCTSLQADCIEIRLCPAAQITIEASAGAGGEVADEPRDALPAALQQLARLAMDTAKFHEGRSDRDGAVVAARRALALDAEAASDKARRRF